MASFDLTAPECWFPLPGFDGYEISSHFRARSWRSLFSRERRESPRLLKQFTSAGGYLVFHARLHGQPMTLYLHHVVAEIAHGPRPEGMQVLHRDDNKQNNAPSNLYYGTPLQNAKDSGRNGRHPRGESRSDAKISETEAKEIFRLARSGTNQKAIARQFGIAQQTVSRIKLKHSWAHANTHVDDAGLRGALEGEKDKGG